MYLEGVTCAVDEHGKTLDLVYSGGFGDVYQGTWRERAVAIKRIRPFFSDSGDHERVIKNFLPSC
jgi:hypothetical protein